MTSLAGVAQGLAVWALPLIFAVTLHEAAHGYAALALGDDTARRMGRISLNPLRHVDPFGTLLLPGLLLLFGGVVFGWAKPVPVNFSKLRNPRWGMVAVAIAGPATNLVLATLCAAVANFIEWVPEPGKVWLIFNLDNAIYLNLLLAVFNMIPVPPLDGGRVATGLLPRPLAIRFASLEGAGMLIILAALFILPMIGQRVGVDLDIFRWLVNGPVDALAHLILGAVGPT
ncbi:MAG: site-2 protease family protein [Solirubrobacterales bacterium]